MTTEFLSENLKKTGTKAILGFRIGKFSTWWDFVELVSSGSKYSAIVSAFEHENQPSDSTKVGNVLDQKRDCQLFQKVSIFRKNLKF